MGTVWDLLFGNSLMSWNSMEEEASGNSSSLIRLIKSWIGLRAPGMNPKAF